MSLLDATARPSMPGVSDRLEAYLRQHRDRHLREYVEFLRIPSISALTEHRRDVRRAAEWAADRCRRAGLEHVQMLETGGHPAVYGDWLHAPGRPTVLSYGHFDVQPVDPLDQWETPPFDPRIRGGRVYARSHTTAAGPDRGRPV